MANVPFLDTNPSKPSQSLQRNSQDSWEVCSPRSAALRIRANLSGDSTNTSEDTNGLSAERGQQTADNVRYGQNVSESGMGGKTTTSSGDAQQDGYGGTEAQDTDLKNTRREQGFGPGNNIGA